MFSLIITIIAIALTAALAVATLYYGGTSFTNASLRARVAKDLEQMTTIAGANTVYTNSTGGIPAPDLDALITSNFLSSNPQGRWSSEAGATFAPLTDTKECLAVNASLGIQGIPACSDSTIITPSCCQE